MDASSKAPLLKSVITVKKCMKAMTKMLELTMWAVKDGFGNINYDTLSKNRKDAIYLATKAGGLSWSERVELHLWATTRVKIQVL